MKTKIILAFTFLACAYSVYFLIRENLVPTYIQESVLIDKTDSFIVKPDAQEIISSFHLQDNRWPGTTLRVQTVSNVALNPITTFSLPFAVPLINNPYGRDKEISVFRNRIVSHIDSVNALPVGFHSSSIYSSVMNEINTVALLEGKQKIVIIYSDLLEHSVLFNMYEAHGKAMLKDNPRHVKEIFEKAVKAGKLTGVQVYFIFRPRTEKENDSFARVVAVYKEILEHAGAIVSIGANLIESKTQQS